MAQVFHIHPDTPQKRLIHLVAEVLRQGGVAVYPTDSCYALGCRMGDKAALDRIRRLRGLDDKHDFALLCADLSDLAQYGKLDNASFRLLKTLTPGPYTFLLKATHDTPRRLQDPKRKTVGLRVPANPTARAILSDLGEPLMSTSLILPSDDLPLSDPYDIEERLDRLVDAIVDGGACGFEPSTVVDLSGPSPVVVREGRGDPSPFLGS